MPANIYIQYTLSYNVVLVIAPAAISLIAVPLLLHVFAFKHNASCFVLMDAEKEAICPHVTSSHVALPGPAKSPTRSMTDSATPHPHPTSYLHHKYSMCTKDNWCSSELEWVCLFVCVCFLIANWTTWVGLGHCCLGIESLANIWSLDLWSDAWLWWTKERWKEGQQWIISHIQQIYGVKCMTLPKILALSSVLRECAI